MKNFHLYTLAIVFLIQIVIPGEVYSQDLHRENYEVYNPSDMNPSAICLVIHGLNFKPSKMDWIRDQLLNQGAIVINIELSGHGNNKVNYTDSFKIEKKANRFKKVIWEQWMKDTRPALKYVDSINNNKNLPLYLVGYSLGGLVGANIENELDYSFDKYFLLAPALEIKSAAKILIRLFGLFPKMVVPSKTPEIYRDHNGVSIAEYKALLYGVKQFKKETATLNKAYIIVDKKDELVSSKKLVKLAKIKDLTINVIQRDNAAYKYKHLIVDENSLGTYSEILIEQINSFFEN